MAASSSRVVLVDADVRLVAITGEKMLGGGRMSSWLSNPQKTPESRDPPITDRSRRLEEGGGGGSRSRKQKKAAAAAAEYPKSILDWVREGTIRVGTDYLVGAPDISTLSLHIAAVPGDIVTSLPGAQVKSADEGLIVFSTGPGNLCHYYASSGRYLVYDGAADALFLAPPIDCGFNADPEIFGSRPVVMRTGEATGDFVLALLAMSIIGTRRYYLLTWSPAAWSYTGHGHQQWMCMEVSLPDDVVQYHFIADVAFASGGNGGGGRRLACWADLNWGVLTCDVLSADPKFQLQLLPEDLALDCSPMCLGRRDGHATMGCGVDGSIKFVYMDGFDDHELPKEQITIKTWTLVGQVPDGLCDWVRDDHTTLSCAELWADESFLAIPGLPKKWPPCLPMLSPNEPDVVYFFMSDFGDGNWYAKTTCDHVLGLNLRTKKVQTWSECPAGRTLRPVPSFIATEICRLSSQESSNLDGCPGNFTTS